VLVLSEGWFGFALVFRNDKIKWESYLWDSRMFVVVVVVVGCNLQLIGYFGFVFVTAWGCAFGGCGGVVLSWCCGLWWVVVVWVVVVWVVVVWVVVVWVLVLLYA